MNQIFEFRKQLNIKKIILFVFIVLIAVICTIFTISLFSGKQQEKIESEKPNTTFYDKAKTISLDFKKTYGFIQYNPSENYLMELRTENNLNIFISKKDIIASKNLHEIVSSDIKTYINEFQTHSNISEITEFDYNGNKAYTYSLHYLNSKKPYYLQVIWVETPSCYYTLDIEFPLDDLNNYTNIINDTINSFMIY